MIRTNWRDRPFDLRRIVLRGDLPPPYVFSLRSLAESLRLDVGDDGGAVLTGDLWVGCYPVCDWEDIDPDQVHWVSTLEIPIAQAWLSRLVRERIRYDEVDEAPLQVLVNQP